MDISNFAQKALKLNFFFIFLTTFVFNLNAIGFKSGAPKASKTDFKKEILKVIEIRDNGQYKSAMEMTDTLISKALAGIESGHYYQLLELKLNLINLIHTDEDKVAVIATLIQDEPKTLNEELRYVFMLFKTYVLVQEESLRIGDPGVEEAIINDTSILFNEWSSGKFIEEITKSNDECMALSRRLKFSKQMEPLLKQDPKDKKNAVDLEQLTADFLYSILKREYLFKPVNLPPYKVEELYADAKTFRTFNFRGDGVTHLSQLGLEAIQIMMKSGSIAADLERLRYVGKLIDHSGQLYLTALESLLSSRLKEPESNLVLIELAKYYIYSDKKKAIAYAEEGLKRHPKFIDNSTLKNIKMSILAPELSLNTEKFIKSNAPFLGKLDFTNCTEIVVKAFQISALDFENNHLKLDENELRKKYSGLKKPVFSKKFKVQDLKDYATHSVEISLPALPQGNYILVITNNKKLKEENALIEYKQIHVSNYTYINHNDQSLQTLDAVSGDFVSLPYKIYVQEDGHYQYLKSGQTSGSGLLDFNEQETLKLNRSVLVVFNQGEFCYENYFYNRNSREVNERIKSEVFTDRSIYRPGQTVYYKLIAYSNKKKEVIKQADVEVLFSGNTGELYRKTLRTNEYGSFSDSIVLPLQGFGNFYFSSLNTDLYHSVQVEEYKIPKFEAEWLEIKSTYKLGDSAKIRGKAKAFAGYPISNATVKYTVRLLQGRIQPWYNYKMMDRGQTHYLLTGETKTDAKGEFEVNVKLVAVDSIHMNENYNLNYTFEADVVDINGEQHTCYKDLIVSNVNRTLTLSGPENVVDGADYELEISHTNLQGTAIPFTGFVKILKLKREDQFLGIDRLWNEADTSLIPQNEMAKYFSHYAVPVLNHEKEILVNKVYQNDSMRALLIKLSDLKGQGTYFVEVYSVSGNDTVVAQHEFVISPEKEEPYLMNSALTTYVVEGTEFEPGEVVKLAVLSKFKTGFAQLEIRNKEGLKFNETIKLDGKVKIYNIQVKEADRGGFNVKVFMVHDYRYYFDVIDVAVPYSNKKLELSLKSFRTDLEPGSKEKWTLNVQCPKEEIALIENAAVMYDAALDDLGAGYNDWYFKAFNNFYFYDNYNNALVSEVSQDLSLLPYYDIDGLSQNRFSRQFTVSDISDKIMGYAYLWDFGDGTKRYDGAYSIKYSISDNNFDQYEYSPVLEKTLGFSNGAVSASENLSLAPAAPEIKARKILKELAFFKPTIYADKKGDFNLEFTLPESLTKWKLMVLSHSQTLQSAYLTEYVTTSKKLMVQPNLPRFLRVNDVIKLPVKVINNSNELLKAKLYMKITDPRTMNELKWTANTTLPEFNIAANGSESRTFEITIPNYDGPVSIAFTSQAGIYSDGEEKTLLVLPNKKFLIESMPFTVRKAGVQNLSFASLLATNSNTLVHKSLQVEVTSNPAWSALKSLPYLMDYQFNCSEQLFSKLYANLISIKILNSNKKIDEMFANWRQTKGSLESKLIQNQDLKSATLEETPWYYDAMKETEQMKKLAESMRVDRLEAANNNLGDELIKRQNANGSFSWFPEMQGNEYITGTIVSGFAKLKQLGVDISAYDHSINLAMNYLDQKMLERHKQIKGELKDQPCSAEEVQYLYCKAFFPNSGHSKVKKEVKEMIARANLKRGDLPLISMAQLAIAVKLLEPNSEIPASILKAFDEQSVSNEQMGMYWPKNRGGWYWYNAPIETHAAIMEAYQFVGVEKSKLTDMQIWLLRQKQTQSWPSTRSTADACYVLLYNGLNESEQNVKVFINSKEVKPESIEPGTGYYKQSVPVSSIKPASGNIKVEAAKDQFAYGAVYWQYEEELNKVKASTSGLSVSKRYFKKVQVDNQEKWVEIKSGEVLNVGDEVKVMLSISTDRNLEYVHLKDMRAAGMEPKDVISGYRFTTKLSYQSVTRDLSSNFFIEYLQKGSYEISYELTVQQAGSFECGVATAQCMYAPEYTANSSGFKVKVE